MPETLPVDQTLRFLARALPSAPARLLEVGCGDGRVARGLAARGYDVTALDESLDPDAAAGDRVRWVETDFLFYEPDPPRVAGDRGAGGAPFDAVIFTRSLHHISPLDQAVERAARLLGPGGRVAAEEFAFDRVTGPTARWWYDLEDVLAAAGILPPPDPALATVRNPLGRWRQQHAQDPPLATGHAMLGAIRERFEIGPAEEAPYLYRYVTDRAPDPAAPDATLLDRVARRVFEIEERLIRERDIAAAGIRITGTLPA